MASPGGSEKAENLAKWKAEGGKNRKSLIASSNREKASAKQAKIRKAQRVTGKKGLSQKKPNVRAFSGMKVDNSPMPL